MALATAAKPALSEAVQAVLMGQAGMQALANDDAVDLLITLARFGETEGCRVLLLTHPHLGKLVDATRLVHAKKTALHVAAENGHALTCELLLLCGANIERKDSSSKTAVDYAREGGHDDIVKLLTEFKPPASSGDAPTASAAAGLNSAMLATAFAVAGAGLAVTAWMNNTDPKSSERKPIQYDRVSPRPVPFIHVGGYIESPYVDDGGAQQVLEKARANGRRIHALDMESHGVMLAAQHLLHVPIPVLVLKGMSDVGAAVVKKGETCNPRKEAEGGLRATTSSALAAFILLVSRASRFGDKSVVVHCAKQTELQMTLDVFMAAAPNMREAFGIATTWVCEPATTFPFLHNGRLEVLSDTAKPISVRVCFASSGKATGKQAVLVLAQYVALLGTPPSLILMPGMAAGLADDSNRIGDVLVCEDATDHLADGKMDEDGVFWPAGGATTCAVDVKTVPLDFFRSFDVKLGYRAKAEVAKWASLWESVWAKMTSGAE